MLRSIRIFIILSILVAMIPVLLFGANNDVVVLKNGDKITGELNELSFGRLVYKTDDMGTIYIEWDKLLQIVATDENFEIELENGAIYFGTLNRSDYLYGVQIRQEENANDVFLWQIVRIIPIKDRNLARLKANVSLGLDYTKASDVRKLFFQGVASYRSRIHLLETNFSSNTTTQPGVDDSRRNELNFDGNRYLADRTFAVVKIGLQQNSELGVDHRLIVGGGAGKEVWVTNYHYLKLTGGILMNREETQENPISTTLEAVLNSAYKLYIFDEPKTDVTVKLAILPNMSTWGRVRADFEIQAKYEILKDMTLNLSYYFSFDNKPVTETASRSDWGINFTVGYDY